MSATLPGREPIQIVEIVQPLCANTYGTAPCTASGTADEKCYNTRATCQDTQNYDGSSTLSLFFSKGYVAERGVSGVSYLIPSLQSVSTSPTRINISSTNPDSSGLGNRAVCSIRFKDHPHTDRLVDPYVDGRSWNPLDPERGSFWTRWLRRNIYKNKILINVYEGYAGEALASMIKRSYFLTSVSGPDSNGNVTVTGKDILARLEERKSQAPVLSPGVLVLDLDAVSTSFEIGNAGLSDYPASGTLRINDELMTYTSRSATTNGVTVTGVVRGTDGTTADSHAAEDAVQNCLRYTNQLPNDIVEDLLLNYAGIPALYLNTTTWATEIDTYLSFYQLSTVISEPTAVTELIAALQVNVGFFIWWDEREALVQMKAVRGIDSEPDTITEENHIIEGSFSLTEVPTERISRAWIFYDHRNYVDSLSEKINYRQWSVFANLTSETEDLHGEPSIKSIFGYWLQSGALADTTASKLITRYENVPRHCGFKLDAKDRAYGVGDTVKISHHLDVDEFGNRQIKNWTITSFEEIVPGEIIEYTAEDTTLYGRIYYIAGAAEPDYNPGTSNPFTFFIGNADGLLSDGTPCARIS